jgi:hypothetical protein
MRPVGPNARCTAAAMYWECGSTSVLTYARSGEMSRDAEDLRREVHWHRESLSVQDLLSVSGASGRASIVSDDWHKLREGDRFTWFPSNNTELREVTSPFEDCFYSI